MERFSAAVIHFRAPILLAVVLATAFFAWQASYVRFDTVLSGLWPEGHPFIEIHKRYEKNYGSSLTVYVMLRCRRGAIYNTDTLLKIARITRAIDAIPGVNHDHVISITSRKVKHITLSGSEIHVENLFPSGGPRTAEELSAFRDKVAAAGVIGTLVSFDGTASLISGNFIAHRTDVWQVFTRLRDIQREEEDANHEVYLSGQPVLMGWVRTYQREILGITALSFTVMFCLLYLYIRSFRLSVLPIISTVVSAVWGLGFAGLLGYTLDPLILIIPSLLLARTLSHGVQKVERIAELEGRAVESTEKAKLLMLALFGSGTLGIVTDALGILVVGIATIPVMRELAFFCAFWAVSIEISVLILIPVLISFFGLPRGTRVLERLEGNPINSLLARLAWLANGSPARWVLACFAAVAGASFFVSTRITIGDIRPGTALLWPDSEYNTAVERINDSFLGTDELFVIALPHWAERRSSDVGAPNPPLNGSATWLWGGEGTDLQSFLGVRETSVIRRIEDFQRYMERYPFVRRTFSYGDFLRTINRTLHGNHVKWDRIPRTNTETAHFSQLLLRGTDPGDFDRFVDNQYQHANVVVWLKDHRGATLREIVRYVETYTEKLDREAPIRFHLASGFAGVTAAVNEEVAVKELAIFILGVTIVLLSCAIAFRSIVAAVVLAIPLIVTNFVVMSVMVFLDIGLDVNTLPIVSIGMGVGIDYGIYLLTRIVQEYRRTWDYGSAISVALRTTGRAVFFTATIMVVAVGIWYFLSSFRFMAEMGLLLALVMAVNMLGALIVLPAIIATTQPGFMGTARILVWD